MERLRRHRAELEPPGHQPGGRGHELGEPEGTRRGARPVIEEALLPHERLKKVGIYQNWFEVYQLPTGDPTYAIYEPYQFEEAISYLVVGGDRGVLVDSGNGIGDIKKVVEELTDRPVAVVLTHEHYDHVGGAHLFQQVALYHDPNAIARVKQGMENREARKFVAGDYIWKPLPEGVDPQTFRVHGFEPTTLLEEGQRIDLGGRTLEVLHTPGHSPASVCLLDGKNRVLFTGDHFYPGPLYAHSADADIDRYLESNRKISARLAEYDHVLPGHNEPWVASEVIPRVGKAFETIFEGGGEYSEDDGLRRYRFDGFDIVIRTESVEGGTSDH